MPVVSVQHCLIDLQQNVQAALGLAQDADAFRVQRPDGTSHYVGIRHVELITGVALFKIHLAWEDFLENVFTRYMCGARTVSGYTPVLLKPPKTKVAVAFTELLGSNKYMNWTAYATVKRSQVYFDSGEPFVTTLSAVTYTLDDLVAVRNGFAHRSDYATMQFRRVVRQALGYIPTGITPGRFLRMVNPSTIAGGLRFLDFYANTLLGAAQDIVR